MVAGRGGRLRPRRPSAQADQRARADVVRAAERFTRAGQQLRRGLEWTATSRAIEPTAVAEVRADVPEGDRPASWPVKQAKMSSKGEVLASAVASVDTGLRPGAGGLRRQREDGLRHPRPALPLGGVAGEDQRPLAGRRLHPGRLRSDVEGT